jgi:hypothetical protein
VTEKSSHRSALLCSSSSEAATIIDAELTSRAAALGQIQAPRSAAADDRFGRADVAELTIELATKGRKLPVSGGRIRSAMSAATVSAGDRPRSCSRKDHDGNLPGSASGPLFRVDGNAAPLLGCDIMQGLGERPAMSGGVADGALTLSVRKIVWLADDLAAVFADVVAQGGDVINPKHHRLRGLLTGRGRSAVTNVGHDQGTFAETQLRPVPGPDTDALDEPQRIDQPVDGRADIWIGEFGNHRTEGR